jgi:hypothetical protein
MPRTPRTRRPLATASLALVFLVPLGAACGTGDAQGTPLERDSTETPNGGGSPSATTTPGSADNQYSPGQNNNTGDANSGQPQSGTDDAGGGDNDTTVNGN